MKPEVAADTAHSAVIHDHPFSPAKGEKWGLCKHTVDGKVCNLSGATHAEGPFYEPTAKRPKEKHL